MRNPSLHSTYSLTGQSEERSCEMKRRILHSSVSSPIHVPIPSSSHNFLLFNSSLLISTFPFSQITIERSSLSCTVKAIVHFYLDLSIYRISYRIPLPLSSLFLFPFLPFSIHSQRDISSTSFFIACLLHYSKRSFISSGTHFHLLARCQFPLGSVPTPIAFWIRRTFSDSSPFLSLSAERSHPIISASLLLLLLFFPMPLSPITSHPKRSV